MAVQVLVLLVVGIEARLFVLDEAATAEHPMQLHYGRVRLRHVLQLHYGRVRLRHVHMEDDHAVKHAFLERHGVHACTDRVSRIGIPRREVVEAHQAEAVHLALERLGVLHVRCPFPGFCWNPPPTFCHK